MNAYAHADRYRAEASLRGGWLLLARSAWIAVTLLMLAVFLAGVRAEYAQLQVICRSATCPDWRLTPQGAHALSALGLSIRFYASYSVALEVLLAAASVALGVAIFARRSDHGIALVAAFIVVSFGLTFSNATPALSVTDSPWRLPARLLGAVGVPAFMLFFYLFPTGRFVPRWTRWYFLIMMAVVAIDIFFPGAVFDALAYPASSMLLWVASLLTAMYAQVHRYRHTSGPTERRQTRWVVFGASVTLGGIALLSAVSALPSVGRVPGTLTYLVLNTLFYLLLLVLPASMGIAILKYHLWDIDLIINRTLVYGALTGIIVGLYALVVAGLGTLLDGGHFLISLAAAGLVAVLFAPMRDRLQRGVNRLMYGERDDPYAVLSHLGQRLEGTLAPEAVLPTVVENIARALRLPRATIWLTDGEGLRLGASHGIAPVEPVDTTPDELLLPLTHRGEYVGLLALAPRSPREPFSPTDRRLLRDLAAQSGAAAHAVQLSSALRSSLEALTRSREQLIVAQEDERRRIQRDLHDGLGPVLASMRLRLEACLDLAGAAPEPLTPNLERLYELVAQATGDVRRLVYDLRPPVLDQLGLVPALRQHCERFSRETGIEVSFEADEDIVVPAASEVTVLRVVQEALVNVQKHAAASRVRVRLCEKDGLSVQVEDNGRGFEVGARHGGTGIGSMRERAELLGGRLEITSHPGATRLELCIPWRPG